MQYIIAGNYHISAALTEPSAATGIIYLLIFFKNNLLDLHLTL